MKTKNIQLSTDQARRIYRTASPEFKVMLEQNFTEKELPFNIIDIIDSYEAACAYLGKEPMNESGMLRLGFRQDEIDKRKLEDITLALNEGKYVDWNDSEQRKYYPWFWFTSGGFVFYFADWTRTYANAGYASRLCFLSEEHTRYAGTKFRDLYKSLIDNAPKS